MPFHLWCANQVIAVDQSIVDMSTPRVHLGAFEAKGERAPVFAIERVPGLQGLRLETPLGLATVALEENRLLVDIGEGMFLGELALRLGYYLVTTRAGGVLIHASALAQGDTCLVASGKSGDGKSTLSRMSSGTPGLRLLTDEVVQLFPDGRAGGSPFRSDFDNVGTPGVFRARCFVGLRKADHEAFEPTDAATAFNLAIEQAFEPHAYGLPRVETRRRLMQFLGCVQLGRLAFRKDPAVGPFVASLLT